MIPDDEAITDKIEDYLSGKLSSQERLAFEQDIAADQQLAERLLRYRVIREARELLIADDLRQRLRDWRIPTSPEAVPTRGLFQRFWPLWLLLTLVFVVLLIIFFENVPPPPAVVPPLPAAPEQPVEPRPADPAPPVNQRLQEQNPLPPVQTLPPQRAPLQKDTVTRRAAPVAALENPVGKRLTVKYLAETERQTHSESRGKNIGDQSVKTLKQLESEYQQGKNPQTGYALAKKYLESGYYRQAAPLFRLYTGPDYDPDVRYEASWFLLLSLLPDPEQNESEIAGLFDLCTAKNHYFSPLAQRLKTEWNEGYQKK